jgi:hypothetical protein
VIVIERADERRNALLVEPRRQVLFGEVMGWMMRDLLDHGSGGARPSVLRGTPGDSVVPDHRIRKSENLPRVRRIG